MIKPKDIIKLANEIKQEFQTDNPFEIANYYGIAVLHRKDAPPDFKAHIMRLTGYPAIISINGQYTEVAGKVLCAHELGHALLHEGTLNLFSTTATNTSNTVEYEANLFAIALLCDENDFAIPLIKMDNSTLKYILDYNIN